MKYARLTKEQLEELHPEFINFLSAQTVDKVEWDKLKVENPEVAEQELDVFSDLIWEGVLSNAEYLEHFSKSHIFLFQCLGAHFELISLESFNPEIDLLTKEGLEWLSGNIFTEAVEIRVGKKTFAGDRNSEIFQLIQQGAYLSEGDLYKQINSAIEE